MKWKRQYQAVSPFHPTKITRTAVERVAQMCFVASTLWMQVVRSLAEAISAVQLFVYPPHTTATFEKVETDFLDVLVWILNHLMHVQE